jgi:hypothetical protein
LGKGVGGEGVLSYTVFICQAPMKTPKTALLVLLFLLGLSAYSQINIQTYTTATDTFYWKKYIHIPQPSKLNLKKYSRSGQTSNIDRFMLQYSSDYPQFTNDSMKMFTVKDWKKHLYPIDINNDGQSDIIFSGSGGGESDITRIYLNRMDGFELVFEDYQYITKFRIEKNRLISLQTGDIGYDDAWLYFTRDYTVTWENQIPCFVKGKQTVCYKNTEEPREYYPEPVPFASIADTLLLRASAAKLNEPFNPQLDNFGNILAKYRTKAHGSILARKSYGKGNQWYFVEMSPVTYPSASIFYEADKIPTFILGWVSESSIRVTEK